MNTSVHLAQIQTHLIQTFRTNAPNSKCNTVVMCSPWQATNVNLVRQSASGFQNISSQIAHDFHVSHCPKIFIL